MSSSDEQPTTRRIRHLSLHLNPPQPPSNNNNLNINLQQPCSSSRAKRPNINVTSLSSYLRGNNRDIQEKVFDYFNNVRPDLQTPIEILKDDYRELCMRQLMGVVNEAGVKPFQYVSDDPMKYFAIAEAVGSVDMSLGIKMGVQYRYNNKFDPITII